jgi:hypothetical protein
MVRARLLTHARDRSSAIIRALYFYPPRVLSPIVFPASSGPSPFRTCVLAMIRIEAQASTPEVGHALAQAVSQRFMKIYGDTAGRRKSPYEARIFGKKTVGIGCE